MLMLPLLFAVAYFARRATHVDREAGAGWAYSLLAVLVIGVTLFAGLIDTLVAALIGAMLGWASRCDGWGRLALLLGAGILIAACVALVVLAWASAGAGY